MASGNVYTLLEDKAPALLGHDLSFTIGQTGSLFAVSSFLMFLILVAGGGAAIIRILYALGIRVGTFGEASEAKISESKKIISSVLFSLLFSFGLVLFMLAINPDVVTGDVSFAGIAITKGTGTSGTGTGQPQPTASTSPATSSNYAARLASHNAAVARLAPSGIHTNRDDAACTEAQFRETTPGCTSLAFLPEEAIQMLLRLNAACKQNNSSCALIVSGGTEPGHSTHRENARPVDLRLRKLQSGATDQTDPLYVYIKTVGSARGATGSCHQTYVWSGWTFCDEKPRGNSTWNNHFHVS